MQVIRGLLFTLALMFPSFSSATEKNAIALALDTLFTEYNTVHFSEFGDEIDPEFLERAGLIEVYRGDNYVTYLLDDTNDTLVYYYSPGTFAFFLEEDKEADFQELFSGVKGARVAYKQDGGKPFMFLLDQVFPPKGIEIKYPDMERDTFIITFTPNFEKPIYKLASDIIRDLALYRNLLTDAEMLSAHQLMKLDDGSYVRFFHDRTVIQVSFSGDAVGISFTGLSIDEMRYFLAGSYINGLSQSFIANLPDDKMQIINDRFTVTISILEDIRGESLDLSTLPDLFSGVRLHFEELSNQ